MNSKKRLMSWILAMLMIFSIVPVSVSAVDDCNHEGYSVVSTLKEADCANGIRGIQKLKCDSCDHTWYAQYDEHTMEQSTIDATCDAPAMVGKKCVNCDYVEDGVPVEGSEALGHDMQLDTTNEAYVAATCEAGGLDTLKCSRCDETSTEETEALGHKWVDGNVVEADCANAAGVEHTCANCGETQVVPFEGELAEGAKGHKPEAVEDVAPTCKDAGLTGKTVCSVCGETIEEGTEIPANENAHVAKLDSALKEATCTTTGIGKYVCEYCDTSMGYKTIEIEHTWSNDLVNEDATAIYRICLECGKTMLVESFEGYDENVALDHTHAYEAVVTAPTCKDAGYTTYTCACGDTYTADEVEALGHDWDEGEVTTEPTEETEGVMTYTCGTCGETKTDVIPVLEHTHNHEAVVTDPTCEDAGYTTYTCACGDTYTADEVEALGHDYTFVVVNGKLVKTCSRCDIAA